MDTLCIIKLGTRQGDAASICFIELVDFDEKMAKTSKPAAKKTRRAGKKAQAEAPVAEAPKEEAPKAEAPAEKVEEAPKAEEAKAEEAPKAE